MTRFGKAMLRTTVVASALLAAVGLSPMIASAQRPAASRTDGLAAVRQAALDGTLTRTHGVLDVCPDHSGNSHLPTGCTMSLVASSADPAKPLAASGPVGLGPADLARAFQLPDEAGAAGTIGIIGFGGTPTLAADLAKYRSQYGLPPCTEESGCLQIVGRHGGKPPAPLGLPLLNQADQGLAFESTLDVDMASAACPRCQIRVVELSPLLTIPQYAYLPAETARALADGVDTAIELGADAVSMSYVIGNGVQPGIATGPLAKRMHHPGVAMVASSGDHGVQQGTAHQTWPQELPWVTSAGGVQLESADGGKTFTKSVWDTGTALDDGAYWSAGTTCSDFVDPAIGQPASVAAHCGGHRASSDVSAAASNISVYDTYLPASGGPGGWGVALGTSASSPYLAGLYARAGTTGVDGPNTVYAAAGTGAGIEDVTTGANTANGAADCTKDDLPTVLCVAGTGWDGPTGVGVPDGLSAF